MGKKKGILQKAEFDQWTVFDEETGRVLAVEPEDVFMLNSGQVSLKEGDSVWFEESSYQSAILNLKKEQCISVAPNSAVLVFDMFEQQSDLQLALEAGKWHGVVWEIDQALRRVWKYEDHIQPTEVIEFVGKFREEMRDIMHSWGVQFKP